MRGCNKKKKAKYIVIVFFAIIILGRIFIPWALEPENFRDTKNKINSILQISNKKERSWWIRENKER